MLTSLLLSLGSPLRGNEPVQIDLALAHGRSIFKSGERIVLNLTFTASQPGYLLNLTTSEPASPIDTLVVAPMKDVFPWLADQGRDHPYSPDYAMLSELDVGEPQTITLALNDVFRFDGTGDYTVYAVTRRLLRGTAERPGESKAIAEFTTNAASFHVDQMSEEEDTERAATVERQIRQAASASEAKQYARQLEPLTGDASTRLKLSLFLHPVTLDNVDIDVAKGLWIARDRSLVVEQLQSALADPSQNISSRSLQTVVDLKARLATPFDSKAPTQPVSTRSAEQDALSQLAATLPNRHGNSLVDAAQTIFVRLAQKSEPIGPEFDAAREILITYLNELDDNLEWLLNTYGKYWKAYAPFLRFNRFPRRIPARMGVQCVLLSSSSC